jgi:hypothetical protein
MPGLSFLCAALTATTATVSPIEFLEYRQPRQQQPPPHIFFVLVDDLGYADISPNRAVPTPEVQTPTIETLVRNGVHLTRHYVHRMCASLAPTNRHSAPAAVASIVSGQAVRPAASSHTYVVALRAS